MNQEDEVQAWLTTRVCAIIDEAPRNISPTASFDELGLDSITRASLASEIGKEFNCSIDADATLDNPTIAQLARHVAAICRAKGD